MRHFLLLISQKVGKDIWGLAPALGFWFLILTGIYLTVIYYIRSTNEIHRLQAALTDIDRMEPDDFENFVKSLFQAEGFIAEPKTPTADGVNLVITDWRGSRTAVQAKRYSGKEKINKQSVRDLLEIKNRHGYERALIVTNSKLTHWADEYARANSVETWDREVLRKYLGKTEEAVGKTASWGNLFKQTEYHKKRNR